MAEKIVLDCKPVRLLLLYEFKKQGSARVAVDNTCETISPTTVSYDTAKNYSDCDKAPENYGVKASYSVQPVGGKYRGGTKVEFTCDNRNRVVSGSCSTRCIDGKRKPQLGRCPYLCSYKGPENKGNFLYVRVEGQTQNQKWFVHGTKGRTHCAYSGFEIWITSKYREWTCVDED